MVAEQDLEVLPGVEDVGDADGVRVNGIGDDGAAPDGEQAQARTDVVALDAAMGEISQLVTVGLDTRRKTPGYTDIGSILYQIAHELAQIIARRLIQMDGTASHAFRSPAIPPPKRPDRGLPLRA